MNAQEKYATAVMEDWLSHPNEPGKKSAKLDIAGTFDLHCVIASSNSRKPYSVPGR